VDYVVFVVRTPYEARSHHPDPDVVTEALGLEPDRVWRVGDPRPKWPGAYLAPYTSAGWEIRSKNSAARVPEQVGELLGVLEPRGDAVRSLATAGYEVIIECVVWFSPQTGPLLLFTQRTIQRIADLRCSFGIDYQVAGEE
jgi:hypothetical protein